MNELQIFNSPKFGDIRTIVEDGKALFCGKDVAEALGYAKHRNAIAAHCKGALKRGVPTNGGIQEMIFIPVGDIYRLAARSELPGAEEFESWIFDEVLPSIFERGGYLTPEAERQLTEGLTAMTATVQSLGAAFEALTQRVEAMEQGRGKRTPLQTAADGDNPFEDAPVAMKPNASKMRRQWMRTASEKLNMLADKCGLPSTTVLHNLYQEMEEEQNVILSEVRLKAIEEHQLDDCSILLAVFYDKPLRCWFEKQVDGYLSTANPAW